ncbi:MAG: alpha/beta hydrolase [Bacteroidales bacterium]
MIRSSVTILAFLVMLGTCTSGREEKYVPSSERKREKYATPEPGTYLKPAAYSLLQRINQIMEDPESHKMPSEWMVRMFTTSQKKVLDTLLTYTGQEVGVRIYYPNKESLSGDQPVLLFIHGGGFVAGSVEQYDIMVTKLARVTGHLMVSVEYRLAPEHPFPAAVNDCFAVLRWLQDNGGEIGADTARICVIGDSAGGNLATVMTLICRDRDLPEPRCQILIYPGVTFEETLTPSRRYFAQYADMGFVLTESFLRRVKKSYMGEDTDVKNPYLSPLDAKLTGDLPPALIITAECDPLRDGGREYAIRLTSAGVPVTHVEYSGMIHGFMSFHMILSDALDAMKVIRDYLDTHI